VINKTAILSKLDDVLTVVSVQQQEAEKHVEELYEKFQ